MSWLKFSLPENIKKRVCIYLLQRYLGQFFEKKLTLDQLQIDLSNGTGKVECVSLDVQSINELGEKQNWPLKFIDGYLEELSIYIPWKGLLKESSNIEIKGLRLTLQPKERLENATSMFESMWSSMTSSMQLAEECMKQDEANATNDPNGGQQFEGIEKFAQLIDSVLKRVKIKFIDTVLQFEHVPIDSITGVALKINIECVEYWDLAGTDPNENDDPQEEETIGNNESKEKKIYFVSSFTTKNFVLQGITLHTVEFPIEARTYLGCSMHESITEQSSINPQEIINRTQSRHEVMFGKFTGRQTLMIRLKQSENQDGPKVSIESNSSSLLLFLSPRQVHVMLELAHGLASPDLEDNSNSSTKQKCTEKPMTSLDYERVEQDLQQQLHPLQTFQTAGLQGIHGWSTAPLEEESDDVFYPMKSASNAMCDSTLSNASSSLDSSLSSSIASSCVTEPSVKMRRKVANIESDPTAEISHFQIRLASLVVVLLHEDILTLGSDTNQTLLPSSVKQMANAADAFFKQIGLFAVSGYSGNNDFEKTNQLFQKACKLNHLRFLAANLQIEGNETTTQTAFSISGKFTTAKMELIECLHDSTNQETPISYIVWWKRTADDAEAQRPNVRLSFKHIQRNVRSATVRCRTKTDVSVVLESCQLEMDITLIDRINALLNPQPVCAANAPKVNKNWCKSNEDKRIDSSIDFKIKVPHLLINLRFPVPDFRPSHDMQKVPWWKRNVRPDYLQFTMSDVILHNESKQTDSDKYSLICKTCHLFYYENERSVPLALAKTNSNGSKQPKIVLEIYNKDVATDSSLNRQQEGDDLMTQSMYGLLSPPTPKQGGPFSAKKVVHESDTPHARHPQDDPEEMVLPGNKKEMDDFVAKTVDNCRTHLDIELPIVSLQLVAKHVYEVLYNRINSDLLLWTPNAPKPKVTNTKLYENVLRNFEHLSTLDTPETFAMCKSGIQYDSDSESDDDSNTGTSNASGVFYSIYDTGNVMRQSHHSNAGKASNNKGNSHASIAKKPHGLNAFALTLRVGQGLIYLNTPVRDLSTNVIPNQQGEFCLLCNDALLFSVNGYEGDDDLGFVCLQVANAQLYHCEMMSMPSQTPPLKEVGTTLAKHLHPTIYASDAGTLAVSHGRGGHREMLTVAVKIQANHETHHVKTVRVAIGINKMTLKHRMCHEPNTWITQLIDFFNVLDYPIAGYHPKDVLTELHLHLWDCAIDYRPLHLPLRSLVTMASFSMSSHLSAQANTSTLRFIAEDCNLFLSSTKEPWKTAQHQQASGVDLKRNYVSVLDFDLFELSLRTNDKKSGINPHIDLRASNNIVHIRTCSDSGRALMQLITYFAMDGDLLPNEEDDVNSPFASPKHNQKEPEELVHVTPQDISNLSQEQHEHVNELLGEAMVEIVEEATPKRPIERSVDANGAQVFFFPDENHPIVTNRDVGKPLPQVTNELGDVAFLSTKNSDTDEEYYFVEADLSLGLVPRSGTPEIRWLTEDAVRVIENHFAIPVGKTDFLKPPKHYPTPVMRYTLCEMSLIWHMYGGNDFKPPPEADGDELNKQKRVNFARDLTRGGQSLDVGYSNVGAGAVTFNKQKHKKTNETNWIVNGGARRDANVLMELKLNKVKFQHELYPETTIQASRQVLLISELEIRDRLESSQINKFLYQYTSQAKPKQTHANMVAIKAVHIRPDPKLMTQECCLKISILPLRLNIDQDALLFLIAFFNELGGNSEATTPEELPIQASSKHNTPTHQPPIMTVSVNEDVEDDDEERKKLEEAHKLVDENLLILLEEETRESTDEKPNKCTVSTGNDSLPIYFRSLLFSPDVQIRLDYHGKRVDMTRGPIQGLLMGLGQLNCSELRLKRLSNRHGLLGIDKLLNYLLQEWLNDIKKNQLPSLLGGVGPMHSLLTLFQGIRDLFWLPIEQYQKDGRIVRGLQRGASSFTTSTAMAALELTSRIIHLIQITAETAYDMMSPGPSVRRRKIKGHKRKYQQPQDIREGVANACLLVKQGIGETADNFVRIASHEHEQKGYSGAVGGVLREIPSAMVKPIIIASEATSNVLGGMRSQLVPDARQEANQKWRSDDS